MPRKTEVVVRGDLRIPPRYEKVFTAARRALLAHPDVREEDKLETAETEDLQWLLALRKKQVAHIESILTCWRHG